MHQSIADFTFWEHLGALFLLGGMVAVPLVSFLVIVSLLHRVFGAMK